jgi:hypothetical protein
VGERRRVRERISCIGWSERNGTESRVRSKNGRRISHSKSMKNSLLALSLRLPFSLRISQLKNAPQCTHQYALPLRYRAFYELEHWVRELWNPSAGAMVHRWCRNVKNGERLGGGDTVRGGKMLRRMTYAEEQKRN